MRDRDLENIRLETCRACTGYMLTPLLPNCACRHCGETDGLPTQTINDPPDQPFLNGPASNCPLGYWDGLVPLDASEVIAREKAELEAGARKFIRVTEPFVKRLPDPQKDLYAALDEGQTTGIYGVNRVTEIKRLIDAGLSERA